MAKVTAIIPAYNIENYIEKCIVSVQSQTLTDLEIIIINDGSTDRTLEKISELEGIDERIIVINKKNEGIIEARKSGFNISTSEYILFVDGDDWLEINALESLYNSITEEKSDIVFCNAFWSSDYIRRPVNMFDLDSDIIGNPLKNLFINNIMPSMCTKLIRKSYIIDNCIEFPNNISYAEDLATVSNWFMHSPKVSLIEDCLYNYYQRGDSITKSISEKVLDINKAIYFIEEQLIYKGLYIKYKKEFEKMIFVHAFIEIIIYSEEFTEVHNQIYRSFKKRKINIRKNKYIVNLIGEQSLSLRWRVISYNYSYLIGRTYDFIRMCVKAIIN